MTRKTNHYLVFLCLVVFAGFFTNTVWAAGNIVTQPHCMPSSHCTAHQNFANSCIDQCIAECEPGHWYTGLCRGVCILGCSQIPPDFPS